MSESKLVSGLIEATNRADFGELYGAAVADDQRAEITRELLDVLELRVTGWLPAPMAADTAITAIHERVAQSYRRAEWLVGVNLVILEHLARAVVGLSDFLTALTEEEVCLYAAVLLNASQAPAEALDPVADEGEIGSSDLIEYEIAEAAFCAATGDPRGWQEHVARALEVDPVGADRAARRTLADRLRRHQIELGMVAEVANGAFRLARGSEAGPFSCPAYLIELAIRRSLGEPGCVDYVDGEELVHATTETCGLLDLAAVLLPNGWGMAVDGTLDPIA